MIKFPAVHIDFERGRETSTRGEGDFTFKSFGEKKEIYGGVSFLKEPESIKEKKHTHTHRRRIKNASAGVTEK